MYPALPITSPYIYIHTHGYGGVKYLNFLVKPLRIVLLVHDFDLGRVQSTNLRLFKTKVGE